MRWPVDEATWRTTDERTLMLAHLQGAASARKLRLYGCACVRQAWGLLPPECRRAVEIAEAFAEGEASSSDLARAIRLATSAGHANLGSPAVWAVQQIVANPEIV